MTSATSILRWVAIALVGLAIAAAVAFAASKLVSQRIGLSSEPLNAGKELAPPETHPPHAESSSHHGAPTTTTTTTTTTGTPSTPTTTVPAAPTTTAPAPSAPVPSSDGSASEGQGPDD
jgi:hypothetical protein